MLSFMISFVWAKHRMQCNTMMIEDILIFVPFSPVSVHFEILLTIFFINFIEITRGFANLSAELYEKAFLLAKEV